jgi:nitrate reductase gamma subunit
MKTTILFQMWPYAATILFGAGMALRYTITRAPMSANRPWRSDERHLLGPAKLLQVSLLLLLLGHLGGLLFPRWILQWNSFPSRLYLFEALAFGVGFAALWGWAGSIRQHLGHSDGPIPWQAADIVFLSVLFIALLSGSLIAILFRWGSSWGVLTLTPYVLSLLRGHPAVELVSDMPFLVRLHVFAAFTTLALLPATRVATVLFVAFSRSLGWILRPVHGLVDLSYTVASAAARRLNPATWIWPEED